MHINEQVSNAIPRRGIQEVLLASYPSILVGILIVRDRFQQPNDNPPGGQILTAHPRHPKKKHEIKYFFFFRSKMSMYKSATGFDNGFSFRC